ncbi:MAG: hypothetical protein GY847_16445 [Proteobacteria bacterium]|nr:hypothetical protein [Pseudomonadota bacterium]
MGLAIVAALFSLSCEKTIKKIVKPFERPPTARVPNPPPVEIKIVSVGTAGYQGQEVPTVIRYEIRNNGGARDLYMEFQTYPASGEEPSANARASGIGRMKMHLDVNEVLIHEQILPHFSYSMPIEVAGAGMYLVAVNSKEELLGATRLPEPKYGEPILVIGSTPTSALEIQKELQEIILKHQMRYPRQPDIALLSEYIPTSWWEYANVRAVVLSKPWLSLSDLNRSALAKWVNLGGHIVVIEPRCPDWSKGPWRGPPNKDDNTIRYGNGSILVAQETKSDKIGEFFTYTGWHSSSLGPSRIHIGGWVRSIPLISGYLMPSKLALLGLILLIVIVLGPVTHIYLIRKNRRDTAWVVVPGVSVLLGICMYGFSSFVKGETRAIEVHQIIASHVDSKDSSVATAIRVQSAKARQMSVEFQGNDPIPISSVVNISSQTETKIPPLMRINRKKINIDGITMHRWSTVDAAFMSVSNSRQVEIIRIKRKGLRIRNTGNHPLEDVIVSSSKGWVPFAERISPQEKVEVRLVPPGSSYEKISLPWRDDMERSYLARLIVSASWNGQHRYGRPEKPQSQVVIARCKPEANIQVLANPDTKTDTTAHCVWFANLDKKRATP